MRIRELALYSVCEYEHFANLATANQSNQGAAMRMSAKVMIGLLFLFGIVMGDILVGYAGGNPKAGQEFFLENCQHGHGPQRKGNG